ncbi:hypothetical protein ACJ51O_37150 (plasmid) [Burkholderia pyrrocinia]|uniref:hypothetical protein n=1 Tax=Burkholderia pyrrocinia TaxID=60550 RepID=UPI0038B4C4D9
MLDKDFSKIIADARHIEKQQLEDLAISSYAVSHGGTRSVPQDVRDTCRAFVMKARGVVGNSSRTVDGFHQGKAAASFDAANSALLKCLDDRNVYDEVVRDFRQRAGDEAVDRVVNKGKLLNKPWTFSGSAWDLANRQFKDMVANAWKEVEVLRSKGSLRSDELVAAMAGALRTEARVSDNLRDFQLPGDSSAQSKEPKTAPSSPDSDDSGSPSTDITPEIPTRPTGLSGRKPSWGSRGGGDMDGMNFSQWDNCFSPQTFVDVHAAEVVQAALEPVNKLFDMLQPLLSEWLKQREALPSTVPAGRLSADNSPSGDEENAGELMKQTGVSVPVSEMGKEVDSKSDGARRSPPAPSSPPPPPPSPPPTQDAGKGSPVSSRFRHGDNEYQLLVERSKRAMPDLLPQIKAKRAELRPIRQKSELREEGKAVQDTDNLQVDGAMDSSGATPRVSQTGEVHHAVREYPRVVLTSGGDRGGTSSSATSAPSSS